MLRKNHSSIVHPNRCFRRRSLLAGFAAGAVEFLFPFSLTGQSSEELEAILKLKGAFLYNFIQFTEWPSGSFGGERDSVRVAFLGYKSLAEIFRDSVRTRTAQGRPIEVHQLSDEVLSGDDTLSEEILPLLQRCHMICFSEKYRKRLVSFQKQIGSSHKLWVGDFDGFAEAGGTLELKKDSKTGSLRFAVNVASLKRDQVRLSSKLMRLAEIIDPENS